MSRADEFPGIETRGIYMRDFFNMDCIEGMKNYPDKYFDLAIVDPPYGDAGGGMDKQDTIRGTIRPIQIPRTGIRGRTYSGTEANGSGGYKRPL